ncbi:helix-turn-helix domain-containing protein [Kribbella jiaozuonensis]|uniref:Helix-turn-helix transcriptional regulator n=1 Tax=Kribbella jiaozuonensis TaxID=2575441 RepID=A0A4U3LLA4_9ACTN|nr:AraC family transcriptional regulator [Kribbella jiaozuonensis]TKK76525.1 helix-turn-helix transcriptional regulator [Kribbella jiaozuonensis]
MDQSYDESHPLPQLSGLVRTVWIQRTGSVAYVQRDLPTGGVELHCPVGGVPRLVGPLTHAQVQVIPPRTTIVGVRFMPGAGTALLGVPADELVDCAVELWGPAAVAIGSVVASGDPVAALLDVQRYLARQRLRPDPLVAELVRRLMPWDPTGIASLADDLALSESQLRRRCLSATGVGPKTLQRTLRFQGYLALAQAGYGNGLADLAAETGYADHAHLTRECVRLTGVTPRELLGDKADRCDCGHDHSASYRPFLAGWYDRFLQAQTSRTRLPSAHGADRT